MSYYAIFTLVFFAAFITMVAWTFRPGRKKHYQELGALPVEDDKARMNNAVSGESHR
ncbi:cbb3-type cytochrome oxidase subunit 3 [Isoalcanivorax beigongshangi]|uniref:Cbb3-type cytochrome oxidase subunit 3 n=1 Tax=Isoalcanivorax beigongshangi TaxID=3238810 RepID=A0ABV4AKJ1_9GAMM